MSRYKLCPSRHFRRHLGADLEMGCPLPQLHRLLDSLSQGTLPEGTLDRALSGRGEGCRECVVGEGFTLVYRYSGDRLILYYINPPKKPRRFSMFILTEIKYRLLRARGRTALLLCVAALLVGSLSLYLGNIQASRDALSTLSGRVPVVARVVSRSGSRQDGLFIDTKRFDSLTSAAVHDVRATTTFAAAYSDEARAVPIDEFSGGDMSVKGANCMDALNMTADSVEFLPGYGPDCLGGNEPVCILRDSFAEYTGLGLGDELSVPLYGIMYGTYGNSYSPVGEPPLKVVGMCAPAGSTVYGDAYAPIQFLREHTESAGEVFSYESLNVRLDDPMELNAFKDSLMGLGFLEPFDTAGDAYSGDAISMEDEMFIKTASELSQNLEVFDGFLLPFFALIIGMITLVTFLVLRGSRREMAIASSLGRQKSLNAASHFFGAIIAELLGCIAALPVMCAIVNLMPMTALAVIGVYMACACVGTTIALVFILHFDPLELLTKVD